MSDNTDPQKTIQFHMTGIVSATPKPRIADLQALADAVESALCEARAADQAAKDASLAASAAFDKWWNANERYKSELRRQKELEKSEAGELTGLWSNWVKNTWQFTCCGVINFALAHWEQANCSVCGEMWVRPTGKQETFDNTTCETCGEPAAYLSHDLKYMCACCWLRWVAPHLRSAEEKIDV